MTAEEILDKHTSDMKGLLDFGNYAFVAVPYANAIKAMKEYAEQRIREELKKFYKYATPARYTEQSSERLIEHYLKQRQK